LSFLFSSRRRHTSSTRDWSSDVCSSDLFRHDLLGGLSGALELDLFPLADGRAALHAAGGRGVHALAVPPAPAQVELREVRDLRKIGRASCRERGYISARELVLTWSGEDE